MAVGKRKAGAQNADFLKGDIESIPLPANSVDVIISNCVINLAADKDRVLREAFRVLKPGGRFAVSDVVTRGAVPAQIRESMLLWVGCVAGALEENEYRQKLAAAGFEAIDIESTRIYRAQDARALSKNGSDRLLRRAGEGRRIGVLRARRGEEGCSPKQGAVAPLRHRRCLRSRRRRAVGRSLCFGRYVHLRR